MQQAAQPVSSLNPGGFAGMLAALSGPGGKKPPVWDDQGLAEDVATLSYERALRTHARYRPAPDDDQQADAPAVTSVRRDCSADEVSQAGVEEEPGAIRRAREAFERNLKRASVTVRLSAAEREQLDSRAGEAGLTVSAYLRSCTFEAEALRAQVKEALAELRAARSKSLEISQDCAKSPTWPWWRRLLRPFLLRHRTGRELEA